MESKSNETVRFRVDSLFVHPIKACGGVRVTHLNFLPNGMIQGDREWVVVGPDDAVVWQGSHPRLALLKPGLQPDGLALGAPGESTLQVPIPGAGSACQVRIWNDATKIMETYAGFEAGGDATRLLEQVTGAKLRLVRLGNDAVSRKSVNPVHLVSRQSLDELNRHLVSGGGAPTEIERLRPNVVLDATDPRSPAFAEERIAKLMWGADAERNELSVLGKCVRCVVPNVNPHTAEVTAEPLRTISVLSAQRYPGEPICLGIYGRPGRPGQLAQGEVLNAE